MTDSQVTTAFHFSCEFCHAGNDYRHTHAPNVNPYLVSRRCETCHRVNQLGFLLGTLVEDEGDVETSTEQIDQSWAEKH
jgi:hypothetical protein